MKITKRLIFCIIALISISLNGCIATKILNSEAKKRTIDYQHFSNVSAYIDSNKDLHLCLDLHHDESAKPIAISQRLSRSRFTGMAAREEHLDASEYITGCEVRADFTPIQITVIDIDQEIKDYYLEYYNYINKLPMLNADYSLYLLNSKNFNRIPLGCNDCKNDLSHTWPRLVIKENTNHNKPAKIIHAGRLGDIKGSKQADMAKAAAIDVITFPFQVIFVGFYILGGEH